MTDKIDIVLAAYNGSRFIREQLDSILNQTEKNWHLILSDDGSADGTEQILDEYAARYPDRIERVHFGRTFGNARDHFFALTAYSQSDYIFYCDQDDVWFRDKVVKMMARMHTLEAENDRTQPLLVFSDQIPTDADLKPLSDSLMKMQNQYTDKIEWQALVLQNVVTGGAMLINRSLANLSLKCRDTGNVIMHDWWLAILAAKFGHIAYLPEATGYYRQHGDNVMGAKAVDSMGYIGRKLGHLREVQNSVQKKKRQASELQNTFCGELTKTEKQFIESFAKKHSGLRFYLTNKKYLHGIFRFAGMTILG